MLAKVIEQFGTDPANPDTDGGNLGDKFEVFFSHPNATNADTDDDDLREGMKSIDIT